MNNQQKAEEIRFRCSSLFSVVSGGVKPELTPEQRKRLAEALDRKRRYEHYQQDPCRWPKINPMTKKHREDLEKLTALRNAPESLGAAAISEVERIWLRKQYHFDPPIYTKQLIKGIELENDARALMEQAAPMRYVRVKWPEDHRLVDSDITGVPDYVHRHERIVDDAKTTWNLKTFRKATLTARDFWQQVGYLRLLRREFGTDFRVARVFKCLVSTPEHLIYRETESLRYRLGVDEDNKDFQAEALRLRLSMVYDDIPWYERVKVFTVEWRDEYDELISRRCKLAREQYYQLLEEGLVSEANRAPAAPWLSSSSFGAANPGTWEDEEEDPTEDF